MAYRWFTRRSGTPFTAYGPVTRSSPLSNCFRKTTRLPRKRPARRMSTVPGVMDFLSLARYADDFTLRAVFLSLPNLAIAQKRPLSCRELEAIGTVNQSASAGERSFLAALPF